jgi:hypothetical protein
MNNTLWDISVTGVGSVYDHFRVHLSSLALLSLGGSCLFVPLDYWFITSGNISYRTTCEQKICVLLHKSILETLQLLVEAYSEVAMKKTQVCKWHKHFVMAMQVLMKINAVGDCQPLQMIKTMSMCAMLCEMTDKRVFRRSSFIASRMQREGNIKKNGHETAGFFCKTIHLHAVHW